MSSVWELVIALAAIGVVVWLPGAVVIKLGALLHGRHDDGGPSFPAGGPAMDL